MPDFCAACGTPMIKITPDQTMHPLCGDKPPAGDRQGDTYEHAQDYDRLNRQSSVVWDVMRDGQWHTLAEVSSVTGEPEASVSARLRDFRKDKFGAHTVERARDATRRGLFWYRVVR